MSTYEISPGKWRNYSLGDTNNEQITLPTFLSVLLVGAISTFIGIVGTQFWTIIAFIVHQWRAEPCAHDGLHYLQQATYRNAGSPLGAAWTLVRGHLAYTGWRSWWKWRKPDPPFTDRRKRRSAMSISLPVLTWALFTVAGLLASPLITHPPYKGNDVRAKAINCGFKQWNTSTLGGQVAFEQDNIRAARDALAYVDSCYNTTDSTSCFTLPQQQLQYNTRQEDTCPFGDRCKAASVVMETVWLNSHTHFGMNAPKDNRIEFRKQTVCAVVDVSDLTRLVPIGLGFYSHEYYLGPIESASLFTSYALERQTFDYVGYDIQPFYAHAEVQNVWTPISDFSPADGDVGLFVIRFGTVNYQYAVSDPLFATGNQTTYLNQTRFLPADVAGLISCIDRYQLQTPDGSIQTNLSSLAQVQNEYHTAGFNDAQVAAATRLILPSVLTGTYSAVFGLGVAALRAQRNVFSDVSIGLPDNQWQLEVVGWFETTLALLAREVVTYVSKTYDETQAPYFTPRTNISGSERVDTELANMCTEQKLRNITQYQTFSLLGLEIIAIVGLAIILLSLLVEQLGNATWHVASWLRKLRRTKIEDKPELNSRLRRWTLDSVQHLQRLAYQNAGQGSWERCSDDFPVVKGTLDLDKLEMVVSPGHYREDSTNDRER